jgi:hypothetical protein
LIIGVSHPSFVEPIVRTRNRTGAHQQKGRPCGRPL